MMVNDLDHSSRVLIELLPRDLRGVTEDKQKKSV